MLLRDQRTYHPVIRFEFVDGVIELYSCAATRVWACVTCQYKEIGARRRRKPPASADFESLTLCARKYTFYICAHCGAVGSLVDCRATAVVVQAAANCGLAGMGQSFQPNGPNLGKMGAQVKANDMTGVPKELQTWNGMQARMDPDRARASERKKVREANSVNYIQARRDNLQSLREKRIELAERASKAGNVEVNAPCMLETPFHALLTRIT